jgi:hypothetical protein
MNKAERWKGYAKALRNNDRAAIFEFLVDEIVAAGLPDSAPYFVTVHDDDGTMWPKAPQDMSANDIFEYVDARFGPAFAEMARQRLQLTTH